MAIHPPQIPGLTDWRPLARGGFALVWEARQESLDRLVAVKVDERRLDTEPERLRFLREAGAAGKMSAHPGIVTVHDAGILADDRPYLVMDLCPGGSLTSYLKAGAQPGEQRVRDIGVRIADALAATHARGVLHRDVKPANILIDAFDNVGLADFGLAALAGPATPAEEAFEALTPAYTAPEILRREPPRATGDVYSLAATMYALLSGRPPRWPESGSPTLAEVLRLQQQPVEPLPGVDPALMAVLLDALVLDPGARPDAVEFGARLTALRLGAPVEDDTDAVVARADTAGRASGVPGLGGASAVAAARPPLRRRRGVLAALAALLLVAVLVGALVVLDPGGQPAAVVPAPPGAGATTTPPSGTATSGSTDPGNATPGDPTPTKSVPDGFEDCSTELGGTAYCAVTPECWGGIISVMDSPRLAPRSDCSDPHNYQTFAAGPIGFDVRRQSQLAAEPEVSRLCRPAVLRGLLNAADRDTDWEVVLLPPQESDGSDRYFRCLFGLGERDDVIALQPPS